MKRLLHLFRIATLAGALAATAGVWADERPVIRAGFIEFPPLATTNAEGEATGTFIHLAERVAERAGYDIRWQELPIGRIYLYLEQGKIDMWPGSARVPELAPYTLETDFRPGTIRLNAYRREETPDVGGIDELQGKNLILIRGYTYWRLLDHLKEDPETFITVAPDHRSAIRMLAFGRGDYLINFQSPMDVALDKTPFPELRRNNLLSRPLTFVFSKPAAGTGKMVDDFNRAWKALKAEGPVSLSDH